MAAARAAEIAEVRTERNALRRRATEVAAAAEGRTAELEEGRAERKALRRRAEVLRLIRHANYVLTMSLDNL